MCRHMPAQGTRSHGPPGFSPPTSASDYPEGRYELALQTAARGRRPGRPRPALRPAQASHETLRLHALWMIAAAHRRRGREQVPVVSRREKSCSRIVVAPASVEAKTGDHDPATRTGRHYYCQERTEYTEEKQDISTVVGPVEDLAGMTKDESSNPPTRTAA